MRKILLIVICISFTMLACNLSTNRTDVPPTLIPSLLRNTPLPTLGYATPITDVVTIEAITNGEENSIDVELYNLINEIDINRLMSHVYILEDFYTRHVNSSQTSNNRGIGAAADYISEQFTNISEQSNGRFIVTTHPFQATYDGLTTSQRNIVGILNGTEAGAGIIVIGAHYDSRTYELSNSTDFAPGADDNGSGVAAVIEFARILSRHNMRSTVVFVLFAAEEVNRQGSKAFVETYIQQGGWGAELIAMINIDTIGSNNTSTGITNDYQIRVFSDNDNSNLSSSRHLARTIELLSLYHHVPLEINIIPAADRDGRYGDHFSFTEVNFPAIRFIEAVEDSNNREGGDISSHIEPDYFIQTTQTILSIIKSLADGLRPPRQVVLRDSGTQDENGNSQYVLVWNEVLDAQSYIIALRQPGSYQFDQSFVWQGTQTQPWSGFSEYEAVAVAAVGVNGLIGPVSQEFIIRR